jgi:hypothetical protein
VCQVGLDLFRQIPILVLAVEVALETHTRPSC